MSVDLKPWNAPAERYAHGTRARYVAGRCRCDECRAANARYYHDRQARIQARATDIVPIATARGDRCRGVDRDGDGIPEPCWTKLRKDSKGGLCRACREHLDGGWLVPAGRVRRRLRTLSKAGVGYKAAADACGAARSLFAAILSGQRKRCRRSLELRVLALDKGALADHALVDGDRTSRLLSSLVRRGWPKAELARRLGYATAALQLKAGKVTVRNAHRVEVLYRRLKDESPKRGNAWTNRLCAHRHPVELERDGRIVCARCGRPVPEDRVAA